MMTYEEILQRMFETVDSSINKNEGSLIYNALAPAAAELAQMYIALEEITNRTYADTATGEDLTKRADERGVNRTAATYAIRKGEFNVAVPLQSRFSIEDTTYIVTENISEYKYKLQCEQAGEIGNVYSDELHPITYVAGLTTATLTDILIPGEDEESDDNLRTRYYENIESQAFGGNQADYKTKVKALDGVSGCKVYPVWNGGGTVKLVIIDSTYATPSSTLISTVQTAIDPIVNQGKGLGLAPIGHIVTVEAVSAIAINISFAITTEVGYTWADISSYVTTAIESYLLGLRKTWGDYDSATGLVVRISQIESSILQITGVLDITGTTLNSLLDNLTLLHNQIPILGTVTNV